MTEICYTSFPDKRRRYVAQTIPAIMAAAKRGAHALEQRRALVAWMNAHGAATAERLHDAARAGLYKASERDNCDPIQEVEQTINQGGDCDQWAAVVMAGLLLLGFTRIWLVTTGDSADAFRHAAVEFFAGGKQWLIDPKFDRAGVAFNTRADAFPVRQHWRLT